MALKVGELYASFGIDSSDLGKALSGIEKQCAQAAKTLSTVGAGMTLAVTAPLIKLGKDILQSSIDFESAFAGVKKTVDAGALAQAGMSYEMLADSIKRLSIEAPQSTEALAAIMEAGGQLGIDVTALEGFTKTIAALGVTTNMTTDEAASMFAKFANITGMSQSEFENLGSTIVALGNNFATTENDIMRMAMRMASAGTTVGMSETDILGFAAAMSSVGIMAEVGGSSFSTFVSNLALDVATSGDNLKTFASVAGMTADEFKVAFEQDAASAINKFILGLNDMDRNGMSAIQILDKLGISEVGMRNMLLALANSEGLLGEALEMSADAWESNIAMLEEANQRYATTESQLQIMKNALELIKIDLGDFALPFVKNLTGDVVAATKAFLAMDDATKVAALKMGGLAAAAGPALTAIGGLVGFAGKLVPIMSALISPVGVLGAGLALFSIAAVDANNDIGKSLENLSAKAKKALDSGNASLPGLMKKVSSRIPAIAGSIVKTIGNTVPGVFELGFTALTGFADSISENADVIANVGMSIVENVCSGLSSGLPKFIPAAAQMVTSIGSALISNLPRLVTSIGDVAASIWDGLKGINWGELGKQLIGSIGTALSGLGTALTGWFNTAVTGFQNMSWADIAVQIVDSIAAGIPNVASGASKIITSLGNLLSSVDWGGLAGGALASATKIGESLMNAIVVGITNLGNLGVDIVKAIGSILASIDWESVTVGLDGFGQMLTNGLVNGIAALGDAGFKIIVAIGDILANVDWSAVGDTAADLGEMLIDGIIAGVGALANAGTQLVTAITDVIGKIKWDEVGTAAVDLAGKLFDGLLKGAASITPDVSELMSALGRGIAAAGTALGDAAGSIISGLVTAICSPESWTTLVKVGGEIVRGLAEGIVNLGAGIIEGAWNLLAGTVKSLLVELGLITEENPVNIHFTTDGVEHGGGGVRFPEVEAGAQEAGESASNALASGISSGEGDVENAASKTATAAEVALKTLPDVTELLGGEAATGMATGIANNGNQATQAMSTLSTEVVAAALQEMSYSTGYQTGYDYANAMKAGILAVQGPVAAAAGVIASGAKNMAASAMSYFVGSSIGYNFSSGIAGGIRSGIGLISDAAIAAALAAVNAAKGSLDINSPSRVGRDVIGKQWDAGIAEGVWGNAALIYNAAEHVVGSMRDSFMVGDPSHGTVYSSGETARQTAKETAAQNSEDKSLLERAKVIGTVIAEELIGSGVLEGDFIIDGETAGRKVAGSVSRKINRDSKKTVSGRTGKAVFA